MAALPVFTVAAVVFGVLGLTLYPTNASVSSIFFGIGLCIVFVIPIGIITSITGAQITLNVFAEFIGGIIYPGNALAMSALPPSPHLYLPLPHKLIRPPPPWPTLPKTTSSRSASSRA